MTDLFLFGRSRANCKTNKTEEGRGWRERGDRWIHGLIDGVPKRTTKLHLKSICVRLVFERPVRFDLRFYVERYLPLIRPSFPRTVQARPFSRSFKHFPTPIRVRASVLVKGGTSACTIYTLVQWKSI